MGIDGSPAKNQRFGKVAQRNLACEDSGSRWQGASARDCICADNGAIPATAGSALSTTHAFHAARLRLKLSAVLIAAGTLLCGAPSSFAQGTNTASALECVAPAAEFHKVSPAVLKAILKVESSFNPRAINKNENGSIDVGIAQMNSIHFKELAKYGIAPDNLFDACTATYVAAWHLGKQLTAYGNTWFAIGAYHSATPYYNERYQSLVYNALVDMGEAQGPKLKVAPLKPKSGEAQVARGSSSGRARPAATLSDILATSQ